LLSTWSAGAVSARISKEEVERWIWTLAPLELREPMPSDGAGWGSTRAPDAIGAPSINGVVGSSLYISPALLTIYTAQRCRQFEFAASGEKSINLYVRRVQRETGRIRCSAAAI